MIFTIALNRIHISKFIFSIWTVHTRFCQKLFEATCDIWTEYQGASTMDWNVHNYINLIYV